MSQPAKSRHFSPVCRPEGPLERSGRAMHPHTRVPLYARA
nr:MAG TPA: hypothetical protein [Caudoviricetes sp.]